MPEVADLPLDDAALLVIDVQVGMDDPARPPRNNLDAEEKIAALLRAFRGAGLACIHVRQDDLDPASPFAPGQPGHPIKDLVAPLAGEVLVTKHVNSAFIGTGLGAMLREQELGTLYVTGLAANYCVESTARSAGNLGFDTYLVEDATAAWDHTDLHGNHIPAETVHAVSMATLHQDFATIVSSKALLSAIERRKQVAGSQEH